MDDAATTTVLVIVAGAMITLAGLVFTALTTVMQTGMMSLSVRIVPLIRRDRIFRWSMATFISAFGYCVLVALAHAVTDDRFTPLLSTAGALLIVLVGAGLLIALVARTLHLLDPATLLATMATVGHRSLDGEVVRFRHTQPPLDVAARDRPGRAGTPEVVRLGERPPTGSALLAVNTVRLNALQRRWGVDITLLCGVGDALTSRTPVLSLASATDGGRPALTPARRRTLLGCLAIGDAYAPRRSGSRAWTPSRSDAACGRCCTRCSPNSPRTCTARCSSAWRRSTRRSPTAGPPTSTAASPPPRTRSAWGRRAPDGPTDPVPAPSAADHRVSPVIHWAHGHRQRQRPAQQGCRGVGPGLRRREPDGDPGR